VDPPGPCGSPPRGRTERLAFHRSGLALSIEPYRPSGLTAAWLPFRLTGVTGFPLFPLPIHPLSPISKWLKTVGASASLASPEPPSRCWNSSSRAPAGTCEGVSMLTRNAAAEAKHKRKQEQREIRTDARRERRHQKAEAKRARKANVKPAAKWNAERKAADKLKKIANRPAKQEKRHRRLGLRAEKLEAQAKKLMAEAQKARARFEYLNELKAVCLCLVPEQLAFQPR